MKPLLLALLLAAPLHAVETEGPSKGAAIPSAGPQAHVPSVPSLPQGLGLPQTGLTAGVPASVGLPQAAAPSGAAPSGAAPMGVGAEKAGVPAFVVGPAAELSGPESGPRGVPETAKPGDSAAPKKAPLVTPASASASDEARGGKLAGDNAAQAGSDVSAEGAKAQSDAKFDGQAERPEGAPAVAAPKGFAGRVLARLGLSRFTGAKAEKPKTAFDRDAYGGPQKLDLTRKGKLLYGLRWGLSLTGLATLLQLGLGVLFSLSPWQLHVSKGLLQGAGRVELLTGAGPHAIAQAVATHPLAFLLVQMPLMTLKEELLFRGLQFGLTFLLLTAIRPVAAMLAAFVAKMPDLFGYGRLAQRALNGVSKISAHAFSIAAVLSAWSFAVAHFAAWGVDPVTIAVHGVLGLSLAYVAYKTRSLATAFTAHLTYNLLGLGAVALAALVSPPAAVIYGLAVSVVSIAGLYLHWRSYRKAKGLATAQARLNLKSGLVGLMLVAMLGGSILGTAQRAPLHEARYDYDTPAWTVPVKQPAPQKAPQTAPAAPKQAPAPNAAPGSGMTEDQLPEEAKQVIEQLRQALGAEAESAPAKLQGLAAVTAQAKQSVVEVINPGVGLGSGYVVSEDGLLLTNAHVAEGAVNGVVIIKFENGMKGPAKVVAINHDKDIAVIQLPKRSDGQKWQAIPIAQPNSVNEGDEVLAMGHPLGLPFTVTRGIVSGVGDRGNLFVEHIQTDAAINHGNSGGPLVNARTGEVVGMDTQIASTNDGNMGLGFAISAKDLRDAVEQYRATGNINSAWLGIIINRTGEAATTRGIEIEEVRPGSPAAKAGLQPGDVVLGANSVMFGEPQQALHQLAAAIAHTKPGQPIAIAIGRDGNVGVAKIVLADKS